MSVQLDYARVASRIFDQPLLIEQRKLNTILRVLSPRMGFATGDDDSAGEPRPEPMPPAMHAAALSGTGAQRQDAGHYVAGDVAVIPVIGSLVQRGGYVGYSGMTSYDAVERMLDAALADTNVRSIVLELDSPGGEVAGAFDLAEKIFQARGQKRIVAAVSELAASAGYLIASAASEITVPRTGYTGSIGVVTAHVDYSAQLEQQGVAVTFIYAGDKKIDGSPYAPLSNSALADITADIQSLYTLFVDTVARNRSLSAAQVRATQAGMYLGAAGIDAGLADHIGTFSDAFRAAAVSIPAARRLISKPSQQETTMSEQQTSAAETQTPPVDHTAALSTARADGASAERTRIESILGHADAQGREATASHLAFKTELPADQAIALMQATPKAADASGNPLDAAMRKVGASGVRPEDDDAHLAPGAGAGIDTHAIYRRRNERAASHSRAQ